MTNQNTVISFIGAGHMGGALIGGLIASGYSAAQIWVSCPDSAYLDPLQKNYNVHTTQSNKDCSLQADALVLAVTPQVLPAVLAEISTTVQERRPLVISIAAGIEIPTLQKMLSAQVPIIRAMPNTPALIRCGATALYASPEVSSQHRQWAEMIFNAVGMSVWLHDEAEMFSVTALSGTGPAYFFLLIQALEEAAAELGLSADVGVPLLLQTAVGSAQMALTGDKKAAVLAKQAASPGGGTEQALKVLEEGHFRELVGKAVAAAKKRYEELAAC